MLIVNEYITAEQARKVLKSGGIVEHVFATGFSIIYKHSDNNVLLCKLDNSAEWKESNYGNICQVYKIPNSIFHEVKFDHEAYPKTGDLTKDLSAPQLRDFIERYATRAAGADIPFIRVSLKAYMEKYVQ